MGENEWKQLYQKALQILDGPNQSNDGNHGGLMILGELLRNSDFFREEAAYLGVGNKILRYMGERNTLVKKTVIELCPVLAKSPHFVKHFLNPVCKFILDCLNKNKTEIKETCYSALGDLALEVKYHIGDYLKQIIGFIK